MSYTPSFLQNCFVIFDLSLCGEESGVEEDEILFFHPPGILYNSKLHFIGWCAAMMNFAKNFAEQPLEVASLDKFKVAFKQVDSIAMILTGTADQPESTLVNNLNLLYDAFRFYNRSFQSVADHNKSRKDLHQKMAEIGRELVPLLSQAFHSLLRSFNPIPYTPLIHKGNRHVIQASQLLHFVEAEPGNLSGCVIYKNSVICTHLDFTTTRFVLNRLDFYKSSMYSASQSLYTSMRGGGSRMEPVCDFIPVYMLRQSVEKLIADRDNMFPFSEIQVVGTPTMGSVPFPRQLLSHTPAPTEEVKESDDGYTNLGLCIVSVHDVSIAILMTFKAFSNKQHINRSIWKIPADPHFQSLESDLEGDCFSVLRPSPSSPSSSSSASSSNSNPSSPPDSPNSPQRPSFLPQQQQQQLLQQPLLHNARMVQSPSYNFFTYDPLTESATVTPLSPAEYDFAQAISFMHHAFSSEPSITEIIRKDSAGEIFGKQVFGREVYYQLKNGSNISHDKFLEVIEKTVRTTLKEDHNINMI
jgi:hypothetical protein